MFGVEMRTTGVNNYDHFSMDILNNGKFKMGKKEFTTGAFGCAMCNLSKEFVTHLLILGGELNITRKEIELCGGYNRKLFDKAQRQIHDIADYVRDIEPFCWFDVNDSLRLVDRFYTQTALDEVDQFFTGKFEKITAETYQLIARAKETYRMATYMITVYCYLCNDTANFGTMLVNFVQMLMVCDDRSKDQIALCAATFCNSEEIKKNLENANVFKDMDGVNLQTRVSNLSAILVNPVTGMPYIARRLYFGRLMDFFVTEWFEGMALGHYIWKCGVCGRYFLMTTAHHQLYCKQLNPKYGTTCDHVANNRRIRKNKGLEKQKRKDNPLWIIRNRRYASIRKNKSLGKYSEAVSDEAKQILDDFYQRAESDSAYADKQYLNDIRLENLYKLAQRNLG